jgi:hypothetical protein
MLQDVKERAIRALPSLDCGRLQASAWRDSARHAAGYGRVQRAYAVSNRRARRAAPPAGVDSTSRAYLCIEIVKRIEKQRWMLLAHLGPGADRGGG